MTLDQVVYILGKRSGTQLPGQTPGNQHQDEETQDFPGGAVVGNPSANAGDTGSSPGPGRSYMPRGN